MPYFCYKANRITSHSWLGQGFLQDNSNVVALLWDLLTDLMVNGNMGYHHWIQSNIPIQKRTSLHESLEIQGVNWIEQKKCIDYSWIDVCAHTNDEIERCRLYWEEKRSKALLCDRLSLKRRPRINAWPSHYPWHVLWRWWWKTKVTH